MGLYLGVERLDPNMFMYLAVYIWPSGFPKLFYKDSAILYIKRRKESPWAH